MGSARRVQVPERLLRLSAKATSARRSRSQHQVARVQGRRGNAQQGADGRARRPRASRAPGRPTRRRTRARPSSTYEARTSRSSAARARSTSTSSPGPFKPDREDARRQGRPGLLREADEGARRRKTSRQRAVGPTSCSSRRASKPRRRCRATSTSSSKASTRSSARSPRPRPRSSDVTGRARRGAGRERRGGAARRRLVRERLAADRRTRGRSRTSSSSRRRPPASRRSCAAGEVDAGLVPSIELLRQRDLEPVGGAGISAFGPVDSVLLLLRRAPHAVRTLALDPASRTSQALAGSGARAACSARGPRASKLDPGRAWEDRRADAVLVIGDRALEMRADARARARSRGRSGRAGPGCRSCSRSGRARPGAPAIAREAREALEAASARGRETIGALARRAATARAARRGGLPGLPLAEDSLRSRRVGDARPQAVPGAG